MVHKLGQASAEQWSSIVKSGLTVEPEAEFLVHGLVCYSGKYMYAEQPSTPFPI